MSIATAISLPNTNFAGTDYFAIYSGDTIRVYQGCPNRSNYGVTMDYTSYDWRYGVPLTQGSSSISNSTFVLDSLSCNDRDSGPHGQIAISSNSLDVPAYMPFKPFYLVLSIMTFIWVISYIIKMMWGDR